MEGGSTCASAGGQRRPAGGGFLARGASAGGAFIWEADDGAHLLSPAAEATMDSNAEVGEEEELDFHLESFEDMSSDNEENTPSTRDPSSKEDDSNNYEKEKTRTMSHADAAERYSNLNEYWNIIKKTVASEEEAYIFYNKYAEDKGFSVRKQKVRRAKHSGAVLFRRFLCSREGERDAKWLDKKDCTRRPRALTRCECPAKLEVRLDRSKGVWYVHNFVDEHNHLLATKDEVPFLWSHRKMKDFQKSEIMAMEAVGIRKHIIMDVLQCRYGGYGKVGIIRKDAYNFSSRYKRSRIAKGDAMTVLGLMQSRQKNDPDFYYDYQLDGDGHLKTMFWCDSQSRMDYQSFGDVVVFDSTYRMNRYKMSFVPFVGLNHHRSTTVFGCGIVSDERIESYEWVPMTMLYPLDNNSDGPPYGPRAGLVDQDVAHKTLTVVGRMILRK